ncbi:MAG: dethiobiotin synthase [Rhodoglobus sp.]
MTLPPIILITGTDTGVGKTVTAAALASHLTQQGYVTAVYKPCQTGARQGDSDALEIARLAAITTVEVGVTLTEPMAPVAAAKIDGVLLPVLKQHRQKILQLAVACDHVIVEGAGGLLVELDHDGATMADLAQSLGSVAGIILVVRAALGTLNHTALTREAIARRQIRLLGLVIGSWPTSPGAIELSNREQFDSALIASIPANAAQLSPREFREQAQLWCEGFADA